MRYRLRLVYLLAGVVASSGSFSIVVLPDTQFYTYYAENSAIFTNQTLWVRDQVAVKDNPRNISFVTHLGDVVNDGFRYDQWDRANASMSVLGPPGGPFVVPFSILPGNHDYLATGVKASGNTQYVSYFGPARFSGASWYGGADPSGRNSFQFFSGSGMEFLHIALEWQPNDNTPERNPSPLEWAAAVLRAYPSMPVVLSTHEYLKDFPPGRSRAGEAVFNSFVRTNDQIFMVLCGHFHLSEPGFGKANNTDGEWHQVSTNDFGRQVVEVLSDYQDWPNGGDGWLRIITFDLEAGLLRFETYSPTLDRFQTESIEEDGQRASNFTISLDLKSRFSLRELGTLSRFGQGRGHLMNAQAGGQRQYSVNSNGVSSMF